MVLFVCRQHLQSSIRWEEINGRRESQQSQSLYYVLPPTTNFFLCTYSLIYVRVLCTSGCIITYFPFLSFLSATVQLVLLTRRIPLQKWAVHFLCHYSPLFGLNALAFSGVSIVVNVQYQQSRVKLSKPSTGKILLLSLICIWMDFEWWLMCRPNKRICLEFQFFPLTLNSHFPFGVQRKETMQIAFHVPLTPATDGL